MKTVAIFTGYYLPHLGGVERYVDKISEELSKLGYRIVIVTSNHDNLPVLEEKEYVKIYRLPIYSIFKDRYPIPNKNSEYKKLLDKIEAENIDYFLLNTRFHLTSVIGAKLGKKQSKPVLLIEHGTGHFTVGNKVLDFFGGIYEHILTFYLKRYITAFYGVSKNCNKWLKHFRINAKGVFYNAINKSDAKKVKDLYDYDKDEVVIAYAGRVLKEKGVLNLLDAFMKVKSKHKNTRLIIAGDGDILEYCQQKYTDKKIDFIGRVDFEHVMALFKRTDIFVYPSLYPEGLPTSILEAGLMNCALVATPRGGTEEVIIDKNHGRMIDGGVEQLVSVLDELVKDKKVRASIASSVKYRIENVFDWGVVAKTVNNELKGFDI